MTFQISTKLTYPVAVRQSTWRSFWFGQCDNWCCGLFPWLPQIWSGNDKSVIYVPHVWHTQVSNTWRMINIWTHRSLNVNIAIMMTNFLFGMALWGTTLCSGVILVRCYATGAFVEDSIIPWQGQKTFTPLRLLSGPGQESLAAKDLNIPRAYMTTPAWPYAYHNKTEDAS